MRNDRGGGVVGRWEEMALHDKQVIQLNLSVTTNLGTEESGHCGDVGV